MLIAISQAYFTFKFRGFQHYFFKTRFLPVSVRSRIIVLDERTQTVSLYLFIRDLNLRSALRKSSFKSQPSERSDRLWPSSKSTRFESFLVFNCKKTSYSCKRVKDISLFRKRYDKNSELNAPFIHELRSNFQGCLRCG